ncbi:hypothetical protein GCM10022287_21170 [Gryllotalpicola koreensis]|uniref:Uncharacterized protein n=1 Tax=Gryllotalpicola koreensis TaxID=993086 RepID=A0ABP8A1B5_9MICO
MSRMDVHWPEALLECGDREHELPPWPDERCPARERAEVIFNVLENLERAHEIEGAAVGDDVCRAESKPSPLGSILLAAVA